MTKVAVFVLRLYTLLLSPYIPTQCRFHPTCSHYTMEAIQKKGRIPNRARARLRL